MPVSWRWQHAACALLAATAMLLALAARAQAQAPVCDLAAQGAALARFYSAAGGTSWLRDDGWPGSSSGPATACMVQPGAPPRPAHCCSYGIQCCEHAELQEGTCSQLDAGACAPMSVAACPPVSGAQPGPGLAAEQCPRGAVPAHMCVRRQARLDWFDRFRMQSWAVQCNPGPRHAPRILFCAHVSAFSPAVTNVTLKANGLSGSLDALVATLAPLGCSLATLQLQRNRLAGTLPPLLGTALPRLVTLGLGVNGARAMQIEGFGSCTTAGYNAGRLVLTVAAQAAGESRRTRTADVVRHAPVNHGCTPCACRPRCPLLCAHPVLGAR